MLAFCTCFKKKRPRSISRRSAGIARATNLRKGQRTLCCNIPTKWQTKHIEPIWNSTVLKRLFQPSEAFNLLSNLYQQLAACHQEAESKEKPHRWLVQRWTLVGHTVIPGAANTNPWEPWWIVVSTMKNCSQNAKICEFPGSCIYRYQHELLPISCNILIHVCFCCCYLWFLKYKAKVEQISTGFTKSLLSKLNLVT